MRYFLIIAILLSSLAFIIWHSAREYDADLEADFIRETGMTWAEYERTVVVGEKA